MLIPTRANATLTVEVVNAVFKSKGDAIRDTKKEIGILLEDESKEDVEFMFTSLDKGNALLLAKQLTELAKELD